MLSNKILSITIAMHVTIVLKKVILLCIMYCIL